MSNQDRLMTFAAQHDWGYDAQRNTDGSVTVRCDVVDLDRTVTREAFTTDSLSALRDWAGY